MSYPLSVRFWSKVSRTDSCWLWAGARKDQPPRDYGVIRSPENGYNIGAHRVSWELHYGAIPTGLHVLHRCDNPPCVRPDHLFLGTRADNIADMVSKQRHRGDRRPGIKNPMHKLSDADVAEIRRVWRPGESLALAKRFGVHKGTIWSIARRKHWKHV